MSGSSGDSFFTAHNYYDKQVQSFDPHHCEDLIEAGVRHLSHVRGPIYIAARLQRLADICAGVHVLPIEHWNVKPEPKPEPTQRTRRSAIIANMRPFALGWFCAVATLCALDLLRLAL